MSENIPSVSGSSSGIIIAIVNPPNIADRTDSKFEVKNKILFFAIYLLKNLYFFIAKSKFF